MHLLEIQLYNCTVLTMYRGARTGWRKKYCELSHCHINLHMRGASMENHLLLWMDRF